MSIDREERGWKFVTAIVAVLALGVSGFTFFTGRSALKTQAEQLDNQKAQLSQQSAAVQAQKQQLAEDEKQFTETGYVFEGSTQFARYDGSGSYVFGYDSGNVPYSDFTPPNVIYAVLDVRNTGRSAGSITDVGVEIGDTGQIARPADPTVCTRPDPTTVYVSTCTFPYLLDAQAEIQFYVPFDSQIQTAVSCVPTPNKILGMVLSLSGDPTYLPSSTTTDFASNCRSTPTASPS